LLDLRTTTTGGTHASLITVLFEPAFAYRSGELVDQRTAQIVKRFAVAGLERPAINSQRATRAASWLASRLPAANHDPTDAAMRTGRTLVAAIARDSAGNELSHAELHGPEPYTLTAGLLAGAADHITTNGIAVTGASGPIIAFGLSTLISACSSIGLAEPDGTHRIEMMRKQ
jgi:hypothetical protein